MSLSPRTRDIILLAGVCFLCFFWRLGAVGLFDFNEGLYAQSAREMYLRGDYITPRVNGLVFFDKPPLALWLTAFAFRLFGVSEMSTRLPVALSASALVFLVYGFGARFFSRRAGLLAGAMTAMNVLVFGTARQMTMDIHQLFWVTAALASFYLGYTAETRAGGRWYYAAWFSCGIAFLAKSVPGLLPIAVAFCFVAIDQNFGPARIFAKLKSARIIQGLIILAAVIAPWHVLVYMANGREFYDQYWLNHHVRLLNGTDFNHASPFYYYVPLLFAGFFPWSVFLPAAVVAAVRKHNPAGSSQLGIGDNYGGNSRPKEPQISGGKRRIQRFLLVWLGLIFVLFSVITSKVISYLLPIYPAAALLTADWFESEIDRKRPLALAWCMICLAGILATGAIAVVVAARQVTRIGPNGLPRLEFPPESWSWLIQGMVFGAIVAGAGFVFVRLNKPARAVAAIFAAMFVFLGLAVTAGLSVLQTYVASPLHALAAEAGARIAKGDRVAVYIGSPRHPSVFFYMPGDAFARGYRPRRDDTGLVPELSEVKQVEDFLNGGRPAFILTDARKGRALLDSTPGLKVERQRSRWVLLRAGRLDARGDVKPDAHVRQGL